MNFNPLKISKLVKEIDDATSIYFDIPDTLKKDYIFKPGQYLTIEEEINGEKVRRAYSLCTSPLDNEVAVTVKMVENGRMSTYLNTQINVGETLNVMTPMGKFTPDINQGNQKIYGLFAGGSGITPMMSILKTVLRTEPNSMVSLIYANRDRDSIIFKKELEDLEKQYPSTFKIIPVYDKAPKMWFGTKGYLTPAKVEKILEKKVKDYLKAEYYICGPAPMMDAIKKGLVNNSIPNDKINIEYFSSPTADKKEEKTVELDFDIASVEMSFYGQKHTIKVDKDKFILNTALEQELEPPFSCNAGVCTTCRAMILEGEVEMFEREGLTDKEIEQGYVLTCQSMPRTKNIKLEFE